MRKMISGSKGNADEMMKAMFVCKFMGWDYHTYLNQPWEFIDVILSYMQVENEYLQKNKR
jgi:hypothetical protein